MKFEYGSGDHPQPGYTSVDVNPKADIVLQKEHYVFNSQCARANALEILNIHFIEHLKRIDVIKLVAVWFRMLKSKGKLVTCFPDMDLISRNIETTKKCNPRQLSNHILGAHDEVEDHLKELYRHKSFWTANEYKHLLRDCGFKDIVTVVYQYPHHSKLLTTQIEGLKP